MFNHATPSMMVTPPHIWSNHGSTNPLDEDDLDADLLDGYLDEYEPPEERLFEPPTVAPTRPVWIDSVHSRSKYAPNRDATGENVFLKQELGQLPLRGVPVETFYQAVLYDSIAIDKEYVATPRLEEGQFVALQNEFTELLTDYLGKDTLSSARQSFQAVVQYILRQAKAPRYSAHVERFDDDNMDGSHPEVIDYLDTSAAPLAGSSAHTKRKPDGVLFHRSRNNISHAPSTAPDWPHVLVPFAFDESFFRPSLHSMQPARGPTQATSSVDSVLAIHSTFTSSLGLSGMGAMSISSSLRPTGGSRPAKRPSTDEDDPPNDDAPDDQNTFSRPGKKLKTNGGLAIEKSSLRIGTIPKDETFIELNHHERLASYALEIMSMSGNRHHVIGFYVNHFHVEVWYFDRAGGIGSAPINLRTHPEQFVAFVLGLSRATPKLIGFEPLIVASKESKALHAFPVQTDGSTIFDEGTHFTIQKTMYISRGLLGKGTVVFQVQDYDDPESTPFAVKLSWQPDSKVLEENWTDRLERLRLQGIDGIPHVRTQRVVTLFEGPRGLLHTHFRDQRLDKIDQVLRMAIVKPLCQPIHEVNHIPTFKVAFISLVKGHRVVFTHGKALHGDVSIDNLMVQCDDNSRGVLIDFDMSIPVHASGATPQTSFDADRPGCLPFLACDLLQENAPPPSYLHDLESFLWVLWWIGVGNCSKDRPNNSLTEWHCGTWAQMRNAKFKYITALEGFIGMLTLQYRELYGWIANLSDLFQEWRARDFVPSPNYSLEYERFIGVLTLLPPFMIHVLLWLLNICSYMSTGLHAD